jgi:protein O-mannosyl-transferase
VSKQEKNTKPAMAVADSKPKIWYWIAGILLATLIAYLPMFSGEKEFTNWDDDLYVTDQPLIKDLSGENVSKLFQPTTAVVLNYHPLTMLTLAMDYKSGYDEADNTVSIAPFVRTNILLHLLNTALVFLLLYKLSSRKLWVAVIAALLFGIHPMHVESVAWISERKDLLYCFFFLLSCLAYIEYLDKKKVSMLMLCFALFIASCLSKAMAVPLPLVLLLTDFFYKRKIDRKAILEKLPFIVVALLVGYNTINIQSTAIGDIGAYNFMERILFAAYGFVMYIVKVFIPINLSAFYPYPDSLPAYYYIMPVVVLALLAVPFFFRKDPVRFREVLWGAGVYVLMIALVLQFVSVGRALMADRYSYVAYIGPLFIISLLVNDFMNQPKYRNIVLGITSVFAGICIMLTYQRTATWQNSRTLWSDVIDKYPYEVNGEGSNAKVTRIGVKTAYKNMGDYYASQKMYDSAFIYYSVLAAAGTNDAEVYSNIGNVYAIRNDLPKALEAFSKSISLDSSKSETYLKRGVMFTKNGKHEEAIADLNHVIILDPSNEEAYVFRARAMLSAGHFEQNISQCETALQKFPKNADLWFCKGTSYISVQKYEEGIQDLKQALSINPSPLYAYNIATAYNKMGDKKTALQYAQQMSS